MAQTLCIDWGNTLVKTALFDEENKIVFRDQFADKEAAASLNHLISSHQPKAGILSAVARYTDDVEQTLQQQLAVFLKLDANTSLPLMNAYSSPETLGVDRLAIAVGAQSAYPDKNILAVSLGTCITYNFVQKNRAFRGGAISPGLRMRLRSMHEWTDKLPEVEPEGEVLLLGYDTATCMRSGAIYGMASEIDGMVHAFAEQYGDFNAVLTGGDMPLFANKLKSEIFADPDLLLKGLNLILKHNVPQLH
ncbi:MAG TPA: type III pantothenate kinase [Flavipsychrobacter sp.]|nr:type III pantothenate kinase [Flavipsychrobacter sp.]